jgi:hypothetical protein
MQHSRLCLSGVSHRSRRTPDAPKQVRAAFL